MRRTIGRNLALDLVVAVGMGVTMALVNAIPPTVARRGGLAPIGLAALASAPFVANFLGAFAGRLGPRSTVQLTVTRAIGAASLLVLFLVPPAPVVVGVAIVFWLSLSFGGPFHLRLWGAMYPARLRGRVVGVIGILAAGATTVAFPIWGLVADRFGSLASLRTGSAIGLVTLVGYAIAPNVGVLWLAALAAGTASASIDVGIAAAVSEQTPLATRSAAMAGWNALTGARGIVAAFLMSVLIQVGLVDVTAGLLACAGTSAIGVALFARAGRSTVRSVDRPAVPGPAPAPSPMRRQTVAAVPAVRT